MSDFLIRPIQKSDNQTVEAIIRSCLLEFGAPHEGTAWADPNLGRFSEVYDTEKSGYWVAENQAGVVVGGVGIGELAGFADVCELQKMYCLPEARGTEIPHALMRTALGFGKKYYRSVYLETLDNMIAAQKFYEKYGFSRLAKPLGATGHYACDVCYLKKID